MLPMKKKKKGWNRSFLAAFALIWRAPADEKAFGLRYTVPHSRYAQNHSATRPPHAVQILSAFAIRLCQLMRECALFNPYKKVYYIRRRAPSNDVMAMGSCIEKECPNGEWGYDGIPWLYNNCFDEDGPSLTPNADKPRANQASRGMGPASASILAALLAALCATWTMIVGWM
jgi:hypothetical protein